MKLLYALALLLSLNVYSQETIRIQEVTNNIVMGPFAGNRDLAFGVQNILEEIIQDKDYYLDDNAPKSIKVELLYFVPGDVLRKDQDSAILEMDLKDEHGRAILTLPSLDQALSFIKIVNSYALYRNKKTKDTV